METHRELTRRQFLEFAGKLVFLAIVYLFDLSKLKKIVANVLPESKDKMNMIKREFSYEFLKETISDNSTTTYLFKEFRNDKDTEQEITIKAELIKTEEDKSEAISSFKTNKFVSKLTFTSKEGDNEIVIFVAQNGSGEIADSQNISIGINLKSYIGDHLLPGFHPLAVADIFKLYNSINQNKVSKLYYILRDSALPVENQKVPTILWFTKPQDIARNPEESYLYLPDIVFVHELFHLVNPGNIDLWLQESFADLFTCCMSYIEPHIVQLMLKGKKYIYRIFDSSYDLIPLAISENGQVQTRSVLPYQPGILLSMLNDQLAVTYNVDDLKESNIKDIVLPFLKSLITLTKNAPPRSKTFIETVFQVCHYIKNGKVGEIPELVRTFKELELNRLLSLLHIKTTVPDLCIDNERIWNAISLFKENIPILSNDSVVNIEFKAIYPSWWGCIYHIKNSKLSKVLNHNYEYAGNKYRSEELDVKYILVDPISRKTTLITDQTELSELDTRNKYLIILGKVPVTDNFESRIPESMQGKMLFSTDPILELKKEYTVFIPTIKNN